MYLVRVEHNLILKTTTYVFDDSELTVNSETREITYSTFFVGSWPYQKQIRILKEYGYLE